MARVYVSTVVNARNDRVWARVRDFTDGDHTFLEWTAEFDCPPERETELVNNIGGGVFQGGFDALKRAFGG